MSPSQLASVIERPLTEVEAALKSLEGSYDDGRGLRLQRHAGRVQLTTAPQLAGQIEKFLGLEATSRLSRAGLETLAIIAYQQPITRPQLDDIRGVNSDGVLKSLLSKGLVQELGRADTPGRPVLFGITTDFLQHFGLSSVEEMPPFNLEIDGEIQQIQPHQILKD